MTLGDSLKLEWVLYRSYISVGVDLGKIELPRTTTHSAT